MIPGIDVSHYQGLIDWQRVKAAGIQFAYLKATQGASFVDPRVFANYTGAKAAGIPIGLYHVFNAGAGLDAQLNNWQKARRLYASTLPAWLDVEPGSFTEDSVPQIVELLKSGFTFRDMVYCSPSTGDDLYAGDVEEFSFYGLAVAHYGVSEPRLPKPWRSWEFWQHSQSGSVDGILGPVDLDWFNGDEQSLLNLTKAT